MSRVHPLGFSSLYFTKLGPRSWGLDKFWLTPFGTIPAGFISDGASAPRWAWIIVDPATEFFEASVVHDFLYGYAVGTRKDADEAWYRVSLLYGASKFRAKLGWLALRVGGGNAWGNRLT